MLLGRTRRVKLLRRRIEGWTYCQGIKTLCRKIRAWLNLVRYTVKMYSSLLREVKLSLLAVCIN
jgi:hypothetical protein